MISRSSNITIIGLGLLGGSYAKGLYQAGYKLKGIDIDPQAIEFAKKYNWIVEGGDDIFLVDDADIVISGLYPDTFVKWMKENQSHFKKGCIITDVTGIKKTIIDEIQTFIRDDIEFIASHPMAGKEVSGIKYSDPSIFYPANFIIVPTEKNTPEAIEVVTDIAKLLKFNHIATLSPEEHDLMVGYVSQLTHVIAVSLMNASDNTHLVDYTGDSFRDLTRIAKINENLWTELFLYNKENLINEIDTFSKELNHFKDVLQNEDIDEMKRLFKQSTQRRSCFDKR